MSIPGKLHTGTECAGIAPWSRHTVGGLGYARQGVNAANRFLVEINHLLMRFLVLHHRDVDGEDVARVHAGLRRLHGDERFEKHASAGKKHKGSRNLDDRKGAQTAVGAAGNTKAATRCKTGRLRNVGAWEPRNIGEENCGDYRESRANPEHA